LQNIFGVDIDVQAVETTKLSLLLKVLEGESEQTLATQLRFYHERALPDLGRNIKCGNSLIGTDFYEQQELDLLDEEERYRINVFDGAGKDGFPEIMKADGFDAVIGNPPYVRIQTTGSNDLVYFSDRYETAVGNYDIYCLFAEKGAKLLKLQGRLGFIVNHRFYKTDYGEGLRRFIVENKMLDQTIDFDGFMVFENASINTCLLLLTRAKQEDFLFAQAKFVKMQPAEVGAALSKIATGETTLREMPAGRIPVRELSSTPWVFIWPNEKPVWKKLESGFATTRRCYYTYLSRAQDWR
jgi:Eco57I restriction-modification methylase